MRPIFPWRRSQSTRVRPARARLAVESLEGRWQPATIVAPDLLSQCDTGASAFDNITRNAQPMFAGTTTSTNTAQISLVIDGIAVATSAVKRSGGSSFTLQPATPLAEGPHVARFYDSQTKAMSMALSFTVDATPPSVPNAPTLVNGDDPAQLVFQIRGTAGDRLHLLIAEHEALTIVATGDAQTVNVDVTNLNFDHFAPFAVRVVAEDAAGNQSTASDSLVVTLEPDSPPTPPNDLALDPASDTGVYDDDGITNKTTLTFSGTAVPGQTITLFIDGATEASQLVGADGTFSFTAGPLEVGAHAASVAAARGDGEPGSASSPIAFTIDTTLPVVSDVALIPADLSPNGDDVQETAAFRFTLSETSFVAVYFLDSDDANFGSIPLGVLESGVQEFDLDVPEFEEGTYSLVVVASDLADNVAEFAKAPFTIDLTPPMAPTFGLADGQDTGSSTNDRITNLATPQFTGDSEPGTKLELREGTTILGTATAAADGSWTIASALDEGEHVLTVLASDKAGNSATSEPLTVTIDETPPTVNAGVDQTGMQGAPVTLTAQVDNTLPAVQETWSLVSSSNGQTVPETVGPTLTFTPTKAGVYIFRHVATDVAGNVGQDTVTVTIEEAVPELHVTWPLAAEVGAPFVVHLGFTGADNDPLDGWSISWGDGAHDDVAGTATSATHIYTTPGSYTPIVNARQGERTLAAPGDAVSVQANESPTLTNLAANAPDTAEDANAEGVTIKALAASLGIIDSPGSLAGLAITSADATHGAWQYALDGATWSPLGVVSDELARFLAADETTHVRFVPAPNWSGAADLKVRAWDQTDGRANGVQANAAGAPSISNEAATVTFTITPVNDAPVLSLPPSLAAYRNTDTVIGPAFSVADVDAAHLRMTLTIDEGILVMPSKQGLTIATGSGTPNLTIDGPIDILNARLAELFYRPAAGYLGPVTIAITVNDLGSSGAGGAKVATGTLAFDVVNRPPQSVKSPSFSMNANTTLDSAASVLTSAFVDLDGDTFTIALASPPPVGTIIVQPDGSFRYTPPSTFVGTVSFAVQAFDGIDTSTPLWLTIQVKSVYGLRR